MGLDSGYLGYFRGCLGVDATALEFGCFDAHLRLESPESVIALTLRIAQSRSMFRDLRPQSKYYPNKCILEVLG